VKLHLRTAAVFGCLSLFAASAAPDPSPLAHCAPPLPLPLRGKHCAPAAPPKDLEESDWAGIRAAHTAWEHSVQPVEGDSSAWQAHNKGQQWTTRFDGRGFLTTPQAAEWRWGLELASYGFGDSHTTVTGTPAVKTDGGRLTYQWDGRMEEWFVNDARGLEHGFVLQERPAGAGGGRPLEVVLTVRGGLRASLAADGKMVHFREGAGAPVVNYGGLKVWDADGTVLPSHFAPGAGGTVVLRVEEAAARYPLTIDPIAQQAYLKASNTGAGDRFGFSVAVSGDTVVVGAYQEDSNATGVNGDEADDSASNAGAAYVFVRSGTTWAQQAYLKASNTGAGDGFGYSVAVWDDTVVVGARYESSYAIGVNGDEADNSASQAGAAYVFTRSGTTWTQQAWLKASNTGAGDWFGHSVALSGDTAVVGAYQEDSNATGANGNEASNSASDAGAAYVFTRSGTTWTQEAYLKASNTGAGDNFGYSVAVSGDTVVVGAQSEDSSTTLINGNQSSNTASGAGAAYVFTRSGTAWTQEAYLKASNTGAGDGFGISVAVSGDTVVTGAISEDSNATGINGNQANNSADFAGAAYVFTRNGVTWMQQAYLKASNAGANDSFGCAVALSGDTAVIGASSEWSNATGINGNQADNSTFENGAAYVFARSGATWAQRAYLKAGNAAKSKFGNAVAVSGETAVVGAYFESSNATGVNGNHTDTSAVQSGAASIFTDISIPGPEIALSGSGQTISDGDPLPRVTNLTDFGTAVLGFGTVTRTFTIANTGFAALNLPGTPRVTISGPHASDFTVTFAPAASVAANGGTTAFEVRFTPGAQGLRTASLSIANDDSDENPFNFAIAGMGAYPLSIERPVGTTLADESTTEFGNVAPGASGTPQTFTVRNSGGVALTGLTLSVDGANAGDFAVSAPSGTTVPAGGSVTFTITFTPGGPDLRTCTLNCGINSWPTHRLQLLGFGLGPAVLNTAQQAYLKAGDSGAYDYFGNSVAVSGDTVVVGAPYEDSNATGVNGNQADNSAVNAGAVCVFVRSGTTWTQQAYLKASNTGAGDYFGTSVAISGDTVIVGAYGEASNAIGVNGNQDDNSAERAGAAYVFTRSGTEWTQQAYLKASNTGAGDQFGATVALSGDTVIVGANWESSNATGVNGDQANNSLNMAGAAYVFTRSGTAWTQQAYLKASNPGASDGFGLSVGVSGDTAVVGAFYEDSSATGINGNQTDNSATDSGAAYIFTRSGTTWTQQAYLKASNPGANDFFGYSAAVSGDTVVVAASREDSNATGVNGNQSNNSASDAGATYIFTRSGTTWTQQAYLKASNTGGTPGAFGEEFGRSIAMAGDTLVVGAYGEDSNATGVNGNEADNSAVNAGAAYVFVRTGNTWAQLAYLKASNTGAFDNFGASVAVAGDTVVVGADNESSNATGVSGNQADNSAPSAGAACIFKDYGSAIIPPQEQWRLANFGSTGNGGDTADSADPDQDGLDNLVEWAAGSTPTQPGSLDANVATTGSNIELTFTRSLTAFNVGMGYAVEWSETLADGSWQTTDATQSILSTEGDIQTVRAIVPADTLRRYLRLKVTAP
jgi:hypothetical protein